MLESTELKTNVCFIYKKEPYKVLAYKHTHMGRGGANIKLKAKNLVTGSIINLNFGANDRFDEARIEKKKMQYLYRKQESYFFMDPKSFEQLELTAKMIGDNGAFLQEGEEIELLFWEDKPLDLNLAASVVLKVKQCDPGVKGNSVSNIYKSAVLSNGLKIKVPLFVKEGDKIKVDTRSSEYLERA